MPKLNEYLGSLVSGLTSARLMSDIQAVQIAEEYNKHDLLRHFSVPRMRIDEIEMTIPVAMDSIEEKTETVYEPIDNRSFNSLVYNELLNNLGVTKLSRMVSQDLRSEIARETEALEKNIRITKNLKELQNYSSRLTIKSLELSLKSSDYKKTPYDIDSMATRLEKQLAPEIRIAAQTNVLDNLTVIVEAHKLREEKPESLIYIKLKISEEGMEWTRAKNSDGHVESKLLPE